MTTPLILGALGVVVLVMIASSITPHARARRAVSRRRRKEIAEIRTRLTVSPRATYERQFPKGRRRNGGSGSAYYDGSVSYAGGDSGGSSCDSGGGDSGGGGGDGGGC